ncbi:Ref family recombination enhancement nuclease [Paraburkholderia phosphatilytica]|uniref:Ref family recombination enhancement nuclease n=1 Tax=Paraburkholderia phosphatilytica TaxID=2282883 RepID=UPI000E54FE74
MATAAERRYMGRVAMLGCAVCRRLGHDVDGMQAAVHHRIRGRGGWGRSSNYQTIPVCGHHHQHSGEGIHDMGDDEYFEYFGFREMDLLIDTQRTLLEHVPTQERVFND